LYIKGLRQVTDVGVTTVCRACHQLRVLEVSNVPITDIAGVEIGNLVELRALYMRDNFRLTNRSLDEITRRCNQLEQMTLWGCTKLKQLHFEKPGQRLRMLNLWGCHGLRDDCAEALEGMTQLRTLVVSECHRLSDTFLVSFLLLERLCLSSLAIVVLIHSYCLLGAGCNLSARSSAPPPAPSLLQTNIRRRSNVGCSNFGSLVFAGSDLLFPTQC